MDMDRCISCGAVIPEGTQVCPLCVAAAGIESEVEELRDIADVLSITANTDTNIKKTMEAILRIADRLERKKKNV